MSALNKGEHGGSPLLTSQVGYLKGAYIKIVNVMTRIGLKYLVNLALVLIILGVSSYSCKRTPAHTAEKEEIILLGKWSEGELDKLMNESSNITDVSGRIDFLSGQFLNTQYKESTLIGDANTPEVFVINLEGMDCFTYIDYVEAMRLSDSFPDFEENLKRVRYQSGEVDFRKRNHFFTDWVVFNRNNVRDVTGEVGGEKTKTVEKALNEKEDGTYFLPGISVKRREIKFIPSSDFDGEVIGRLRTGDYVGVYSDKQGLDVSHTGIIIKKGDKVYLRHASSREENRKVVDEDLIEYLSNKPGLIVFRPK